MANPFHRRHRDFEWCDEIRMKTTPRYKESGLSGDEWRTSVFVEFYFKGELVVRRRYHDMKTATAFLPSVFLEPDPQRGGIPEAVIKREKGWCDQPGCPEAAVTEYRVRRLASNEGWLEGKKGLSYDYRAFCARHAHRGDCGLEDADRNYEVLTGCGPNGSSRI